MGTDMSRPDMPPCSCLDEDDWRGRLSVETSLLRLEVDGKSLLRLELDGRSLLRLEVDGARLMGLAALLAAASS